MHLRRSFLHGSPWYLTIGAIAFGVGLVGVCIVFTGEHFQWVVAVELGRVLAIAGISAGGLTVLAALVWMALGASSGGGAPRK